MLGVRRRMETRAPVSACPFQCGSFMAFYERALCGQRVRVNDEHPRAMERWSRAYGRRREAVCDRRPYWNAGRFVPCARHRATGTRKNRRWDVYGTDDGPASVWRWERRIDRPVRHENLVHCKRSIPFAPCSEQKGCCVLGEHSFMRPSYRALLQSLRRRGRCLARGGRLRRMRSRPSTP